MNCELSDPGSSLSRQQNQLTPISPNNWETEKYEKELTAGMLAARDDQRGATTDLIKESERRFVGPRERSSRAPFVTDAPLKPSGEEARKNGGTVGRKDSVPPAGLGYAATSTRMTGFEK